MKDQFSRRDVVKAALVAGATAIIKPARTETPEVSLSVGSTPVELNVTTVSEHTIRLTILPVHDGAAQQVLSDGALVESEWSPALAQIRSLSGMRMLRSGNLTISVSPHPLSIRIETRVRPGRTGTYSRSTFRPVVRHRRRQSIRIGTRWSAIRPPGHY